MVIPLYDARSLRHAKLAVGARTTWRRSVVQLLALLSLPVGRAASQVDPSGSWRTLHTPHFRIHFRPSYRDVALLEAREAERAYRLLASELAPPRQVVDLTLGDDIDGSNGFTTVFPSSQITILASPPANDPGRSEERRVGKECRSRWSPYH